MRSVFLPTTQPRRLALRADEDVVVDHRAVQEGAGPDDDVVAEDGELAQLDAGLDLGVVADVQRALEDGVRVDLRTLADPDARRHLEAGDLDVDLAVEDVGLHPEVGRVRPDVLPVAVGDEPVDRQAFLDQLGEDVAGPVDHGPRFDQVEDLGLHDVDARVDGVAEDLAPGRLLEETLDAPLAVQ